MNTPVQAGPSASAMLPVNAAQAPSDALPGAAGDAMSDGGFKGVLEQRMQSAGGTADGLPGGEAAAPSTPSEAPAVAQLVDSTRIAADAMAAFLAAQPALAVRPEVQAAGAGLDPRMQPAGRGALPDPTLVAADAVALDASGAGRAGSSDALPGAELRAAMDAVSGKRLPQAATDSPASFRTLMADVAAARGGAEAGLPSAPGGATAVESGGLVPANAQAPAAPSPGEARAATTQVATPFGRPEWTSAMNERVTWLVGQRVQSADIQLNPPQLGPVEVRITIQNDQANLYFTSQHAAVREAIQAALPRLNEMLAQGGLSLGQTSVGAESFAGQQQASRDGNGSRRGEPDAPAALAVQAAAAAGQAGLAIARGRVGIDMFV